MARDIIPTGYYKAQRYQGTAIVINENYGQPPVIPPGTVTDLYWASDAAGNNRVTSISFDDETYVIVKTQDITANRLTLQLLSDDITSADMEIGLINEQVEIPLVVQSNGAGFGFYKILTMDEDDMAFRNATWVKYTSRGYDTVYTNTEPYAIAVSIHAAEYNGANRGGPSALYVGDKKVQEGYELFTIVPAGATYRVVEIGEGVIVSWHELRKPA